MGMIIGPTPWWQANLVSACPVGSTLPDGSRIFCKAGGTAWIVAPSCTQGNNVSWAGGQYNTTLVGDKCCISEWSTLQTALINNGFNPSDWFVPSFSQLQSGFNCRSFWDTFASNLYWSSSECSCTGAFHVYFGSGGTPGKSTSGCVRAFRCVTY